MTGEELLVRELKKYKSICFYPSSGKDLSDLDFFGSGGRLWEERIGGSSSDGQRGERRLSPDDEPDLYLHADVNLYQEFASGLDIPVEESGMHGDFEILEQRELPALNAPNMIFENYPHSGRCFEYKLRIWGGLKPKTLIYCLCENEALVAKILLPNGIAVPRIWSRNWAGGRTYGTWLGNVLAPLCTRKVYTDWLCVPGRRGEPRNRLVEEKYPELMKPAKARLVRNDEIHWIDEGAHGWVEEYDVVPGNPD